MIRKELYIFILVLLTGALTILNTGCKKDILFSDGALAFSTDTVLFDTVFTTVGSSTKRFKIYNPSNNPVEISNVQLEGGSNSPYRVNLDGISGTSFESVTIPGGDSLYMFVEVTLDPNNQNMPLIVEDSIRFNTNGETQHILLAAWGQDAYFYYQDEMEIYGNPLPNDKPHVIYDYAFVDSAQTLDIQAGTRIHLHKNSLLFVYKGTLNINGGPAQQDKVIFEGDRLEPFYEDVKGQYYGIYFQEARSSTIDHAIIKNGTAGIHVFGDDPNNTNPTLTVTNTEIYNNSSYGIFNYSGGVIYGENLNIHNNNLYALFVLEGADYNFKHCQFLGLGTDGNQPAIAIKNYFTRSDGITYVGPVNEGAIHNSIIYGDGETQIVYDTITDNGSINIDYAYTYNLIKQEETLQSDPGFSNNLWNQNPGFEDETEMIYKITSSSPCIDYGTNAFAVPFDIEGNARDLGSPDIGAYEIP
tara:strand:+ start:1239 stop:2654 length:1416 start_codon:yes stop_codon:yes gene_type:complete